VQPVTAVFRLFPFVVSGSILSTSVHRTRKRIMNRTRGRRADCVVDVICPTDDQQRCADADGSAFGFRSTEFADPLKDLRQVPKEQEEVELLQSQLADFVENRPKIGSFPPIFGIWLLRRTAGFFNILMGVYK